MSRRMEFIFGDIALTLSEDDIEAVYTEWERKNPGKSIKHMKPKEFSDAVMERMTANARSTRTVIHN